MHFIVDCHNFVQLLIDFFFLTCKLHLILLIRSYIFATKQYYKQYYKSQISSRSLQTRDIFPRYPLEVFIATQFVLSVRASMSFTERFSFYQFWFDENVSIKTGNGSGQLLDVGKCSIVTCAVLEIKRTGTWSCSFFISTILHSKNE